MVHETAAILVKKGDKILLAKRGHNPWKDTWGIPGGHVKRNESPLQAARREAKEELGEVKIGKKLCRHTHSMHIGDIHRCHTFEGEIAGKIRPGDDAKELGWFTIRQMKKMNLSPYAIEIINKLFLK